MLTELLNAVILFGGGLALLLAVVQLFHDRSRIKNILLFLIFMNLGIIHIYEYVASVTPGYESSIARNIFLVAKFILGPSMYIFYLTVFNKEYRFSFQGMLHFLPAVFAVLYVVLISAAGNDNSGIFINILGYMESHSVYEYLHSFGFALIFVYTAAILMKMEILSIYRDVKRERLNIVGATVALLLFTAATMIIIAGITGNRMILRMTLTLTTMFFIYWFVIVQIYPELFSSSVRKRKNPARSDDSLSGINLKKLDVELHQLMDVEKLYCDEDLSLKRLSDLLSLQPHQFSLYLNLKLNMNFNTYINSFRVEESIRQMGEDNKRSLLEIAFSSGFNSKSAFYDAFTKKKGLSPAKYRKQFFPSKKS